MRKDDIESFKEILDDITHELEEHKDADDTRAIIRLCDLLDNILTGINEKDK